jgi:hypothetical protein
MDEELKNFCTNYEVKVVDDQKRYQRYRPPIYFSDPTRADLIRDDIVEFKTERLYTLQIPESRLQSLVEMEKRFFAQHRHDRGAVDMFEMLMNKEREESWYRQSNPAIKKAYEHYSMLLNLAGYQRKI